VKKSPKSFSNSSPERLAAMDRLIASLTPVKVKPEWLASDSEFRK